MSHQELCSFEDVLDLSAVEFDLGKCVDLLRSEGCVRSQESHPDLSAGIEAQIPIHQRKMNTRVESRVNVIDSVRS